MTHRPIITYRLEYLSPCPGLDERALEHLNNNAMMRNVSQSTLVDIRDQLEYEHGDVCRIVPDFQF